MVKLYLNDQYIFLIWVLLYTDTYTCALPLYLSLVFITNYNRIAKYSKSVWLPHWGPLVKNKQITRTCQLGVFPLFPCFPVPGRIIPYNLQQGQKYSKLVRLPQKKNSMTCQISFFSLFFLFSSTRDSYFLQIIIGPNIQNQYGYLAEEFFEK